MKEPGALVTMLLILSAIAALSALVTSGTAQAQDGWQDLGGVDGCNLHKRGACYVLTCDNGNAALSCR